MVLLDVGIVCVVSQNRPLEAKFWSLARVAVKAGPKALLFIFFFPLLRLWLKEGRKGCTSKVKEGYAVSLKAPRLGDPNEMDLD